MQKDSPTRRRRTTYDTSAWIWNELFVYFHIHGNEQQENHIDCETLPKLRRNGMNLHHHPPPTHPSIHPKMLIYSRKLIFLNINFQAVSY